MEHPPAQPFPPPGAGMSGPSKPETGSETGSEAARAKREGHTLGLAMYLLDFFKKKAPPLVQQCVDDMVVMLDTSERMFEEATGFLLDNRPLELDLSAEDEKVNQKEGAIRSALLHHFSINPTDEMVFNLMLMSIVQDAERIGDLAKSIAKAAALSDKPRSGRHVNALRALRDRVDAQFDVTREAFVAGNADKALRVMAENDNIKKLTTDIIQTLAASTDLSVNEGVVLSMSARMIGRVSSHLSNIVSSVALPFDKIRRSSTWADDE